MIILFSAPGNLSDEQEEETTPKPEKKQNRWEGNGWGRKPFRTVVELFLFVFRAHLSVFKSQREGTVALLGPPVLSRGQALCVKFQRLLAVQGHSCPWGWASWHRRQQSREAFSWRHCTSGSSDCVLAILDSVCIIRTDCTSILSIL